MPSDEDSYIDQSNDGNDRNLPSDESRHAQDEPTPLEEVLDDYLEALANGEEPDQDAYIARHPELADALRGVFKTLDFVEATSRTLNHAPVVAGTQLGDFRIVDEIGRGGMGIVYEAVQVSLNRRVALKILPAGAVLSGTTPERFAREAATAGKLHHTNIVPVYAVGEEHGIQYYAMQFIEGCSLSEHLKGLDAHDDSKTPADKRPHTASYCRQAARWGQQVAEALAYAHQSGTIHRDVKPSNLLLDTHGNVWITDFGLARTDAHATLTTSGDVIGTARYMSPEQARGGKTKVDHRTDIYSLGATMYELLALEPAFDGDSREEVLNRITISDPKPLRSMNPAVARDLQTIVAKCMNKDRNERYATAGDVAEDFRRFLAGEPIRARRTSLAVKAWRYVKQHRNRTIGSALLIALALTTVLVVMGARRQEGRRCVDDAYAALLFEGDSHRAAKLFDEAAHLGVNSARLHLGRGLIPLLQNQPQLAIPHLQRASRIDPNHAETRLAQALACNISAEFDQGQALLDTRPQGDAPTALGLLLRGLALSKRDRSEAIKCYSQAITLQPDFAPAIRERAQYRGIRLVTEGDRSHLEPMLSDCNALVVFRPESSWALIARAWGYLYAAMYGATQEDLKPAAADWLRQCGADMNRAMAVRREDDSLTLLRMGLYLRCIGEYAQAADVLRQAIEIDVKTAGSAHPYRHHEYALTLHALGDTEQAIDALAPVCASRPEWCPILLTQAVLLAERGRFEEALAICRTNLEQQKSNLNGLLMAAAAAELIGAPDLGLTYLRAYDQRVTVSDDDAALARYRPSLNYLLGRISESELIQQIPDPGGRCEAYFLIGVHNLARGDRAAGLAALQQCVDTGVFPFTEHRQAQSWLARAKADETWPNW